VLEAGESFASQLLLKVVDADKEVAAGHLYRLLAIVLFRQLDVLDIGLLASLLVINRIVEGGEQCVAGEQVSEFIERKA